MSKNLHDLWIALVSLALFTTFLAYVQLNGKGFFQATEVFLWLNNSRISERGHLTLIPKEPEKIKPRLKGQLPIDFLKGKQLVKDLYVFGFRDPQETICSNNANDVKLILLVTSAPANAIQRNTIRLTWGSFALREDVSFAFFIGQTNDTKVQLDIDKENKLYRDIIQANIIDDYLNLTLKTLAMLEWLQVYCSEVKFILKTDDDMFINVPLLVEFVDTHKNSTGTAYGRLAHRWKVIRKEENKYFVGNDTYNQTYYPDFVTGPAYLFTQDMVPSLFYHTLNASFFKLEDVLIMGFVANSLGFKHVKVSSMKNIKAKIKDPCRLKRVISIHMVSYDLQFENLKTVMDQRVDCSESKNSVTKPSEKE